ncbi:MAG: hypothetical protein Q9186_003111 [Xanthomendoza sp. 1 TL-2023]
MKAAFRNLVLQPAVFTSALLLLPLQSSGNASGFSSVSRLNGSEIVYPEVLPNFGVTINILPQIPLAIEEILSATVDVVFGWALDGWDTAVPHGLHALKRYSTLCVRAQNLDKPGDEFQLRNQHFILALGRLVNAMIKNEWVCAAVASPTMFKEAIGNVEFLKQSPTGVRNATINDAAVTALKPLSPRKRLQSRAGPRRLIDPDDGDFAIVYQVTDKSLTCTQLLSTAVNGLVDAAQAQADRRCRDFMAFNPLQKVQLRIAVAQERDLWEREF